VFGLNTLGGALALTMKNGFNFTGTQAKLGAGSWDRLTGTLESGGNNGSVGYYLNLDYFDESGWRDLSDSDAQNFYGSVSWRENDISSVDLNVQQGQSELIGNGALPVGLLSQGRSVVFTAPDITENDMQMVALEGWHQLRQGLRVSGSVNWRQNQTHSFNGDASEYEICRFSGGSQALFEESDELEDALEDLLAIGLDDICEGEDPAISDFAALEGFIESRALAQGLDPEDFEPDNLSEALSGSGVLSDEAINNISNRRQTSRSFSGQLELTDALFKRPNQLVSGISYTDGSSAFNAVLELADLDPLTRSTLGLGTGTFVDTSATDITTRTETRSWYFSDTLDLTARVSLTLSGRYNRTRIILRDQSGARPELNGDHVFNRFNPALGLTWNPNEALTWYGSYSESNRVPTPIELACNEGVFTVARQYAIERGDDPDDIDFECRLPNAFLADPPLNDVVTSTVEAGVRGNVPWFDYQVNLFNARNQDDILFQTTGRSTGLFANVEATLRRGIELDLQGSAGQIDWYANGSWLQATFDSAFMVLSPNHPDADASGELPVSSGSRIPGLPEIVVKLGADWHVTEDFQLGLEVMHNGNQVLRGDEANLLATVPGYFLVNMRASWQPAEHMVLFARVSNVFNTDYENFGLLGEDPSEVLPGLADARPLFVGVGAPRAAWAGVRYRF